MDSNIPLGYEMDITHPISRSSPPAASVDFMPQQSFQPSGLSSAVPSPPHSVTPTYPSQQDHQNAFQNSVHPEAANSYIEPMNMLDASGVISQPEAPQFLNDFNVLSTDFTGHVQSLQQSDMISMNTHSHSVTPPQHMNPPSLHAPPSMVFDSQPQSLPTKPMRSRSNTSSNTPLSITPVVMSGGLPDSTPSTFGGRPEQSLVNASMLLDQIAQSATHGAHACKNLQGQDANSLLADIRKKVALVSSLVAGIDNMSIDDHSDGTRKRCASPPNAPSERPVKALKSEPQDIVIPLDGGSNYYSPLQSPPASRPPTPGSYGFKAQMQQSSYYGSNAMDMSPTSQSMSAATMQQPPPSLYRSAFSESHIPTRHTHSASTGSAAISPSQKFARQAGLTSVRPGRSGSLSNPYTSNPFEFGFSRTDTIPETSAIDWTGNVVGLRAGVDGSAPLSGKWAESYPAPSSSSSNSPPSATWPVAKHEEDFDENDDDDNDEPAGRNHSSASGDQSLAPSSASEIPQEYRNEVDRIFFGFLNKICSNLEATDSKGEAIHQTLMAKKMQRLDESKDFRPFKFRIQAFTGAFLEELARQGYPEEKIPMKKIRNYLWRQQYIQRFNEDGKKAKSKGNHIWNIEAKKMGDGHWEFRPFHRKIAGTPPSVAYSGLRWSWTARVWDPQASWQGVPVHYSSPTLPSWLSWKDDVLAGVPPTEAQDCEITAVAKFIVDGQEGQLTHTFPLRIAPVTSIDSSFSSRQTFGLPRSKSDTTLASVPQRTAVYPHETRVTAVLQNVVQQVAQETELTAVGPEMNNLYKQRQVLEETLTAIGKSNAPGPNAAYDYHSQALAKAANEVVGEAAQSATAGNPFTSSPGAAITTASVNDMTNFTKDAIAVAVRMSGPASDGVDVIKTAKQLLADSRTCEPQQNVLAPQALMPPPSQSLVTDAGMVMMPAVKQYSILTDFAQ